MLPIDDEFGLLYLLYVLLYSYVLYKIIRESRPAKIRFIIYFVVSLSVNGFLFYDAENFEGGGSLVVLFYSGILFLLTLVIIIIDKLRAYSKVSHS